MPAALLQRQAEGGRRIIILTLAGFTDAQDVESLGDVLPLIAKTQPCQIYHINWELHTMSRGIWLIRVLSFHSWHSRM